MAQDEESGSITRESSKNFPRDRGLENCKARKARSIPRDITGWELLLKTCIYDCKTFVEIPDSMCQI